MIETRHWTMDRLEARRSVETAERIVSGRAVPYDQPQVIRSFFGEYTETIAAGAVALHDDAPLMAAHEEVIGVILSGEHRQDGYWIEARISETRTGEDTWALVRDGAIKGFSIGFEPVSEEWSNDRNSVVRSAVNVREISLTAFPAYAGESGGRVTATRSATTLNERVQPVPTETIVERETVPVEILERMDHLETAIRQIGSITGAPVELSEYAGLGEYARAVYAGTETRAWVDQITTDNAGVARPGWVNAVKGIVDGGRPFISTLGRTPAPDTGMSVEWPSFSGDLSTLIGEQLTQKTEITSAKVSIGKGSGTLKTYAGGSDIALQLIERSTPAYLDAYMAIMFAAYSKVTNAAAASAALTAAGTNNENFLKTDGAKLGDAIVKAAIKVEAASGFAPTVIGASTSVYTLAATARGTDGRRLFNVQSGPSNLEGASSGPAGLSLSVEGIKIVHVPTLTADTAVLSNSQSATWTEDGPRTINAAAVSKLGRDVAVYGYGCLSVYIAAGIQKITGTAS